MKKVSQRLLASFVVAAGVVLFVAPPIEHSLLAKGRILFAPQAVTILAFGDMMLDRSVREYIDANGAQYPFEKIAPFLKGHDIVVANAEGAFSEHASVSVVDRSILRFTFDPSILPTLRQLGFTTLGQANNHGLDFGWSALSGSKELMAQNDIKAFGDPENENPGPLYQTVRGQTIAFVGYSQFSSSGGASSSTVAAIKEARGVGAFTIVYAHWGEEYNLGTTSIQVILAHRFIDAGADVVIGSHPHVIEPIEIYKNKVIFYSIGNFIFDQGWNSAVKSGLAVEMWLRPKTVTYALWPLTLEARQSSAAPSPERSFMLER